MQIPKIFTDKQNWLINMSTKQINYNKKEFSISKIITNGEYNIHNIPFENRNKIRSDIPYWTQNQYFNENKYNTKNIIFTEKYV